MLHTINGAPKGMAIHFVETSFHGNVRLIGFMPIKCNHYLSTDGYHWYPVEKIGYTWWNGRFVGYAILKGTHYSLTWDQTKQVTLH